MTILIAPDKFKSSLSAMKVCQAIGEGLLQRESQLEIQYHPMADGGDGSLRVISQHLSLQKQRVETLDPLGRPTSTFYYTSSKTAFIELAKASGLVLLNKEELDPLKTSTFGTGQMISAAISKGCNEIYLFLGGSATNDGGMGIAQALGASFFDVNQVTLKPCGGSLSKVDFISFDPGFDVRKMKFTLLCDVNNPLFGPNGAAQIYAPQKGANGKMVQLLDDGMRHFSEKLLAYSGVDLSDVPGSGAAGGIAASLVSIFNAEIKSGIESFAKLTELESKIRKADLVISGEGRLDGQSLQGKVIDGIVQLCKKHNKPLVLFVGKNELSEIEQTKLAANKIFSIIDEAEDIDDAIENAFVYLKRLAFAHYSSIKEVVS